MTHSLTIRTLRTTTFSILISSVSTYDLYDKRKIREENCTWTPSFLCFLLFKEAWICNWNSRTVLSISAKNFLVLVSIWFFSFSSNLDSLCMWGTKWDELYRVVSFYIQTTQTSGNRNWLTTPVSCVFN